MNHRVRLFYLNHSDISIIKNKIELESQTIFLYDCIAVFRLRSDAVVNSYIVLSAEQVIDEIVLENGGTEAAINDQFRGRIKDIHSFSDFEFGNEQLINLF